MADADKDLKIRITTQADTPKLREYSRGLDDLGKQTGGLGKSTGMLTAKKRELQQMVRGLTMQFPQLSRVMRMAIHPVTLAIGGIALAVSSLVKSWRSARETFNSSAFGVDKVNAAAQAYNDMADAVGRLRTNADGLAVILSDIQHRFQTAATMAKRFGQDMGDNPLFARRQAEASAAAKAREAEASRRQASGLRAEAEAMRPGGTDARDAALLSSLETDAGAVEPRIAAITRQIETLEGWGAAGGSKFTDSAEVAAMRMGLGDRERIGPTRDAYKAADALRKVRDALQERVTARDNLRAQNEARSAARRAADAKMGKASELDEFADVQSADATTGAFRAQVDYAANLYGRGFNVPVNAQGAGVGVTPDAANEARKALNEFQAMSQMWETAFAAQAARIRALEQSAKNTPE
jgi:uncharacterized protein YoxC